MFEPALLERDEQLSATAARLESARLGRGGVVMVAGGLGLGRTRFLRSVEQIASEHDMEVLSAAGRHTERDFDFGVVLQLFERGARRAAKDERARLFDGPASLAMPLLTRNGFALEEVSAPWLDHGLFWLCANIAERRPLLLALDDADRADLASLSFLLYLSERIAKLPVVLVATVGGAPPGSAASSLDAIAAQAVSERLELRPLTLEGVRQALRETLFPDADDSFCRACYAATRGNPLLLMELALELSTRDVAAGRERSAARTAAPLSVATWVLQRAAEIGSEAVELLRAAAVLGDGAELRHARALAGLGDAEAAIAADGLRLIGVLARSDALTYAQPLTRRAVYEHRLPADRAAAHLDAARLLASEGEDSEAVAAHLMHASRQGSDWTIDALCAAADVALERGAPATAARYLRRALQEPPPEGRRPEVMHELGRAETVTGAPGGTDTLLRAMQLAPRAARRARIALDAGRALFAQGRRTEAIDVFQEGARRATDRDLAARLRAARLASEFLTGRPVKLRGRPSDAKGSKAAHRLALGRFAFVQAVRGESRARVIQSATRALGGGALLEEETADGPAYYLVVLALIIAEELRTAEEALTAALDEASARGSVFGIATASYFRAWALIQQGMLERATSDAQRALAAERYGWRFGTQGAYALLGHALIEHADLDAAGLQLGLADAREDTNELSSCLLLAARGQFELVRREPERALASFEESGRLLRQIGCWNPALIAWRLGAASAAMQLDDRATARRLALEELRQARRFGAPGTLSLALLSAGLTTGGDDGLQLLEAAVKTVAESESPLVRARVLVECGSGLRRAGRRRAARARLLEGREFADQCGAHLLSTRAAEELAALGARPRRIAVHGREALTPREQQVARMAINGMSNKDIAGALFVTVKTVEWHLQHVFQKLHVSSRRELAAVLHPADGEAS